MGVSVVCQSRGTLLTLVLQLRRGSMAFSDASVHGLLLLLRLFPRTTERHLARAGR
jgi:hypothetical protein